MKLRPKRSKERPARAETGSFMLSVSPQVPPTTSARSPSGTFPALPNKRTHSAPTTSVAVQTPRGLIIESDPLRPRTSIRRHPFPVCSDDDKSHPHQHASCPNDKARVQGARPLSLPRQLRPSAQQASVPHEPEQLPIQLVTT